MRRRTTEAERQSERRERRPWPTWRGEGGAQREADLVVSSSGEAVTAGLSASAQRDEEPGDAHRGRRGRRCRRRASGRVVRCAVRNERAQVRGGCGVVVVGWEWWLLLRCVRSKRKDGAESGVIRSLGWLRRTKRARGEEALSPTTPYVGLCHPQYFFSSRKRGKNGNTHH